MQSIEELEQELIESEASTEGLEQALNESRVADLTEIVSKTGKMQKHLTGMTPRQYEKFVGKKPRAGLLVKEEDATTAKVPWAQVLDQLVTERGYQSDEGLKDAIEKAYRDKKEIEKAKADQRALRNEIVDRMKAEPEVETIKLAKECPQFPKTDCTAEVTMVNGMRFTLRRQHSYWRIDTHDGKAIRVRYAKDARKLAKIATKDYKQEITGARAMKASERTKLIKKMRKERRALLAKGREERRLKYQTVTPEPGTPEAGYQPAMLREVPEKEHRPKGRSEVVQISMADQLKLREAEERERRRLPRGRTTRITPKTPKLRR